MNEFRPNRFRSVIWPRSFATATSNTLFARSTATVVLSMSASSWFVLNRSLLTTGCCIAVPGGVHVSWEGSTAARYRPRLLARCTVAGRGRLSTATPRPAVGLVHEYVTVAHEAVERSKASGRTDAPSW